MSDKYKGFLVTFKNEISDEGMERIKDAIELFEFVDNVTPYVKGFEDHMSELQGKRTMITKTMDFLFSQMKDEK